jgi:transposase
MSDEVAPPPRSRAAIRQAWIERLQRFGTAQLSVVAFCQAEGVSAHTFYYWKRQLTEPAPADDAPRLIPVRLRPEPAAVELVLNTATILRLVPGCDLAFVRSLVEALGSPPC